MCECFFLLCWHGNVVKCFSRLTKEKTDEKTDIVRSCRLLSGGLRNRSVYRREQGFQDSLGHRYRHSGRRRIGALVGGEKGALVGAGIGAVGGASVGGYMDIQARRLREELVGTGVQVQKVGDNVRLIMPSNITFDTDSAVFKPVFNNILTSVAKVINEFDKTKVQVAGYTDSTGSAAYNNTLSLQRAQAVANYLKLRDVNASRLMVYGYGSSNPIASNATAAGREQNRRVEITLINVR